MLLGVRIPVGARDLSFTQIVQIASGVHPAFLSMGTTALFSMGQEGSKAVGLEIDRSPHLAPRLRMSGAIPQLPLYPCTFALRLLKFMV
jgi:hypothetical protein